MQKKLGIFPWYSLASENPTKSVDFYTKLLGLTKTEFEMPGLGKTSILQKGAMGFADVSNVPASTPCHWTIHITVEDVDKFLPKAKKYGATIVGEAFDIPTIGRGAKIKDPAGALFMAYTPLNWSHSESVMGQEEGTICWNDLMIEDPKKVIPFYSECFGWKFEKGEGLGDMEYNHFSTPDGTQSGGIMKTPKHAKGFPVTWMVYFMTKDLAKSTAKAKTLGGKICMEPTEIPDTGKFSTIEDPQGGMFYLFQPNPR